MIISRTPLRLSFFGGGSDFPEFYERNGCSILGTTIDKYVYITINQGSPFFDHRIRVSYAKAELVDHPSQILHPSVRETLQFLKMDEYLDIHIFADLPAKTGLGSSSSFTVGFLNACYAYKGQFVHKIRLANEAIHIERDLLKENVGIQDQLHAAHGGFNTISVDTNGIRVEPFIFPSANRNLLQKSLLLFYTKIQRFSSVVVEEQVVRMKDRLLDESLSRMIAQVKVAQEILRTLTGDEMLRQFGALLHEGWEMKKKLSTQVSNSMIDDYYELALKNGAYGGKVSGAGGGGFLMLLVPEAHQAQVRSALSNLLEVSFGFDNTGSTIIYSHEPVAYRYGAMQRDKNEK